MRDSSRSASCDQLGLGFADGDIPPNSKSNGFYPFDHFSEGFGSKGLCAVGSGFFGFGVDFDNESVCACGDPGLSNGLNVLGFAGAVTGVEDDREVGERFQDRNGV